MNETWAAVFPEFEATKLFQMSWSKSMYVVNHGLAPYFKSVLKTNLHKADFLVYSFDESLDDVTQTTEMDLYVRYWDPIENRVKLRYCDSTFLGHGRHADLLNHFKSITNDLPFENCHCVIDIGTCSLHTVHNTFRTGVEATDWNVKKGEKQSMVSSDKLVLTFPKQLSVKGIYRYSKIINDSLLWLISCRVQLFPAWFQVEWSWTAQWLSYSGSFRLVSL